MYAIYGNIYHQYTPNVSIYTIQNISAVRPLETFGHPMVFSSLVLDFEGVVFFWGEGLLCGKDHGRPVSGVMWPRHACGNSRKVLDLGGQAEKREQRLLLTGRLVDDSPLSGGLPGLVN